MNSHEVNLHQSLYQSLGFLTAILMFNPMSTSAQTPGLPILTNVQVKATITQQPSEIYEYRYTIQNLTETQAELWGIAIDIIYPPNSLSLSEEGLVNGRGYAAETSKVGPLLFPDTPKMIPVGLSAPENWIVGLARKGTTDWGGGDASLIKPNQLLDGFLIQSHGLPGIRSFQADPWIDVDALYPSPKTQSELDDLIKQMDADKELAAFKGQTLGPTAPPAQFVALDFLNYIIDLKHQAGTLGWITNPGVQDSLDVKLDQVKKKLEAGDTKTASNNLSAFLNEVDAQGCEKYEGCPAGKHLLPEAWALLKFNAEYLLGKL